MPSRLLSPLASETHLAALGSYDSSRLPIKTIVIHSMVGTLKGTIAHFQNATRSNLTSAHYGIDFNGKVVSFVPETKTAYHAGNYPVNQQSIGIECEDNGKPNEERPETLYKAIAALVNDLCTFYNLPINRTTIRKHNEVSLSPTACPGTLDIDKIVALAKQIQNIPVVVSDPDRDKLVVKSRNFDYIADYFQLSEIDRLDNFAGVKIVERLKKTQTDYLNTIASLQTKITEQQRLLDAYIGEVKQLRLEVDELRSAQTSPSFQTINKENPLPQTPNDDIEQSIKPKPLMETEVLELFGKFFKYIFRLT